MSELFSTIQDGHAILWKGDGYQQVGLYSRKGRVYAKLGSTYLTISRDGCTSKPKCTVKDIVWPSDVEPIEYCSLGRAHLAGETPKKETTPKPKPRRRSRKAELNSTK